jgi:hypothetical protein
VSERTAKTIVLVTAGFMFAAIGIKRSTIPDPFKFAWAAGVITLALSLLADIAPEVAGPFAILVLIAVYWKNKGVLGSVLPGGQGQAVSGATAGAGQAATAAGNAFKL